MRQEIDESLKVDHMPVIEVVNFEPPFPARTVEEVCEMEGYLTDIVWWNRHVAMKAQTEGKTVVGLFSEGGRTHAATRRIENAIPEEERILSDIDWGTVLGKLSALRWLLGYEWERSLDS